LDTSRPMGRYFGPSLFHTGQTCGNGKAWLDYLSQNNMVNLTELLTELVHKVMAWVFPLDLKPLGIQSLGWPQKIRTYES